MKFILLFIVLLFLALFLEIKYHSSIDCIICENGSIFFIIEIFLLIKFLTYKTQ